MKKLLTILFFINSAYAQDRITTDTIISGVWNLHGKVLKIEAKISGNVTIQNAIIEANPYVQIFDTSVVLQNCKAREFSTAWYGAKRSRTDNSRYLQITSDACIANGINNLYVADSYRYSQSLKICNLYNGIYTGVNLNIYGDGNMHNQQQTLTYTGTGFGIGVQVAKGGSIRGLWLKGNYEPSTATGANYYNTAWPEMPGHNGIVVDYDGTLNTSGSTDFKVVDCNVSNYDVAYSISPNAVTFNADNLLFDRIRVHDSRIGFQSNQAQEKGNIITFIESWGKLHTLIQIGKSGKFQAGNYVIQNGNIAGEPVQLFDIVLSGWNTFHVKNMYAEALGRVGGINAWTTQAILPAVITIDARMKSQTVAGVQTIFTSNTSRIHLRDSRIAYFGETGFNMNFSGHMTIDNCDFGASRVNAPAATVIDYEQGKIILPKFTFVGKAYYLN